MILLPLSAGDRDYNIASRISSAYFIYSMIRARKTSSYTPPVQYTHSIGHGGSPLVHLYIPLSPVFGLGTYIRSNAYEATHIYLTFHEIRAFRLQFQHQMAGPSVGVWGSI